MFVVKKILIIITFFYIEKKLAMSYHEAIVMLFVLLFADSVILLR